MDLPAVQFENPIPFVTMILSYISIQINSMSNQSSIEFYVWYKVVSLERESWWSHADGEIYSQHSQCRNNKKLVKICILTIFFLSLFIVSIYPTCINIDGSLSQWAFLQSYLAFSEQLPDPARRQQRQGRHWGCRSSYSRSVGGP